MADDITKAVAEFTKGTTETVKQLKEIGASLQEMVKANAKVIESTQELTDVQTKLAEDLEAYEDQLRQNQDLSEDEEKLLRKAVDARKKELDATTKTSAALAKYNAIVDTGTKEQIENARETHKRAQDAQAKAATARKGAEGDFLKSMGGLGKAFKLLKAGAMILVGALFGLKSRIEESIKTTTGMMESSGGSFTDATTKMAKDLTYLRGIEYSEGLKFIQQNRQVVNAMGGYTKALASADEVAKEYFAITGDVNEAFGVTLESMQAFGRLGVRASTATLKEYAKDIQKLSVLTGMAETELRSLFNEVANDTDSLVLLRAARSDEREAILKSQRAMIQNAVAAGMSADQAKEAAKMLNKMVAAKPLERMKQAARVRALGAALGVAGSEEAAAAIQAGPRATAAQKEALMAFNQAASDMAGAARGAGLGQELFVTQLLDKLDLDQTFGPTGPFNTQLVKAMEVNADRVVSGFKAAMGLDVEAVRKAQQTQNIVLEAASMGVAQLLQQLVEKLSNFIGMFEATWKSLWDKLTSIFDKIVSFFTGLGKFFGFGGGDQKPAVPVEATRGPAKKAPAGTDQATVIKAQQEQQKSAAETATGINKQFAMMQTSNEILSKIHANSAKQIELAEKQLAAMQDTETSAPGRASRIRGSGMVSSYNTPQ